MNFIHLLVCLLGCISFGLSESLGIFAKIGGLYLAFQGAALFIASEIRDVIRQRI